MMKMQPLIPIFPQYVMRIDWELGAEFNERLYELGKRDSLNHRVKDVRSEKNATPYIPGARDMSNYYNQERHNFMIGEKDEAIVQFAKMTDWAVREYLRGVFHYDHQGEIGMVCDALYQRSAPNENYGIHPHNHITHDIICTYYPKVVTNGEPDHNALRWGAVRFLPHGRGKRPWPNFNPAHHFGSWYGVQPKTGTMLIFEGEIMHDSSYFDGPERMCIPVMCKIKMPNSHQYATLEEVQKHHE